MDLRITGRIRGRLEPFSAQRFAGGIRVHPANASSSSGERIGNLNAIVDQSAQSAVHSAERRCIAFGYKQL
jgi:hypothetical protein